MATPPPAAKPVVVIETSQGTIKAELWPDKAPATVASFLGYAGDHFYDGTIFHRVINNFMIQGGGFTASMNQKPTKAPVRNEARTDTPNARGTLAMARTAVVDSATSQFFINLVDNGFLNHQSESPQGFGYCVFGKVTDGMDVVDKIAKVQTGTVSGFQDVPREAVVIKSIRLAD
ncbi:MAG: peptidylprolyl isomerase [Lentisphaerae bacterium]|nr:peptidylprolyl isomerase [Lentisphaerota bacterium]